jgi:hypothetical protein
MVGSFDPAKQHGLADAHVCGFALRAHLVRYDDADSAPPCREACSRSAQPPVPGSPIGRNASTLTPTGVSRSLMESRNDEIRGVPCETSAWW